MQEIELKIERLGMSGEGVARLEGYTIFVDGALPDEVVRARLYEKRKTFGRASIVKILEPSVHRVRAPCPVFGRCGGCQIMHLSYPHQLVFKRQRVVDALERIGKLFHVEVSACEPSPAQLNYRNKIQLPVDANFRMGLYARNSHDLVEIEKCYIHCPLGEKAFQEIRNLLSSFPRFNLRYVLIKTAVHTNQVLVVLVTRDQGPHFLDQLAQKILDSLPEIQGVVQNINPAEGNNALSDDFYPLAGKTQIEEKLGSLTFNVSPASFFQVNPPQAENLYQKTVKLADLTSSEVVLDAYCGVGTLSLFLAPYAQKVVGVETVAQAVADASENARKNGILNTQFHWARAEEFIQNLEKIDAAILNPPRKGCEPLFLEKLALYGPSKVLYISCDPATLARDLALLAKSGYHIEGVHPFDMFPQTAHVETLVSLCKASTTT